MATVSDNKFPKVVLEERLADGSDTANPAADHRALFLGEDGILRLRDSAGGISSPTAGLTDPPEISYAQLLDAGTPGTADGGTVRLFADAGRVYSIDDTGAIFGPFDDAGAGGGLDGLRLTSEPNTEALAIGAFGDEMEYASLADLLAVWAKHDGASGTMLDEHVIAGGSSVQLFCKGIGGRGLVKTGLSLPADFEVGALITCHERPGAGMFGIGIGNGSATIQTAGYGGPLYYITTGANGVYSGGLGGSGSAEQEGPVFVTLRRLSGNWRTRYSNDDLSSFTTTNAAVAFSLAGADRISLQAGYSNNVIPTVHKVVYGAPDLGLG